MIFSKFEDLRREGYTPNFLFLGDSVLHVAAFNAFILMMEHKGIKMSGLVCNTIDTQKRKTQFDATDIVSIDSNAFRYVLVHGLLTNRPKMEKVSSKCSFLFSKIKSFQTTSKIHGENDYFYLIGTNQGLPDAAFWKVAFKFDLPVKCVLLEEGVGSYLSHESALRFFSIRDRSKEAQSIIARIMCCAMRIVDKINDRKVRNTVQIDLFSVFETEVDGSLVLNQDFACWFKRALDKQTQSKEVKNVNFQENVVVVGTNFKELGSSNLESLTMNMVFAAIDRAGYNVLFRPHPRSDLNTYSNHQEISIDYQDNVSFEALLQSSQSKPVAVVGLCSSSQMTASALWGIPCFTIAGVLQTAAQRLNEETPVIKEYINRLHQFDKVFHDYFIPAISEEDLVKKLSEI